MCVCVVWSGIWKKMRLQNGLTGFLVRGWVFWVNLSVYFLRPIGEDGKGAGGAWEKERGDRRIWARWERK